MKISWLDPFKITNAPASSRMKIVDWTPKLVRCACIGRVLEISRSSIVTSASIVLRNIKLRKS